MPANANVASFTQFSRRKQLNIKLEDYESELSINITSGNANKTLQILKGLFEKTIGFEGVSMESIRQLYRNLCYILIKLNVDFEKDIYAFLDKIGNTVYLLKYGSIESVNQVIYNFYSFAVQKYLEESGGRSSVTSKVKSFIEKNYQEDIGLNRLSDLFHMNASYLTRIFKEEEGYSINEYIVKIRVENAKHILESGKVNIQKLAESVGYEDSTYFLKVFKKVTGMTPKEYVSRGRN